MENILLKLLHFIFNGINGKRHSNKQNALIHTPEGHEVYHDDLLPVSRKSFAFSSDVIWVSALATCFLGLFV